MEMSDLIIRQDTLKRLCEECTEGHEEAECGRWKCIEYQLIENMPSADVPDTHVGEWIPCSERLPELDETGVSDRILICLSDGQIVVAYYVGDGRFVGQACPEAVGASVEVTAWMPLPEPWKGGDDE